MHPGIPGSFIFSSHFLLSLTILLFSHLFSSLLTFECFELLFVPVGELLHSQAFFLCLFTFDLLRKLPFSSSSDVLFFQDALFLIPCFLSGEAVLQDGELLVKSLLLGDVVLKLVVHFATNVVGRLTGDGTIH